MTDNFVAPGAPRDTEAVVAAITPTLGKNAPNSGRNVPVTIQPLEDADFPLSKVVR